MSKFWDKNYLLVISVLSFVAFSIVFSFIYLDKVLEKSSVSKNGFLQKINSVIKFQKSSETSDTAQMKFEDTTLWKKIISDYKGNNFEDKYPQSLFRPGIIKSLEKNKSITFISPDNKKHTINTNEMTSFYLPKDYYVNGVEKMSYRPEQISQSTAYEYYLRIGSTIFVEVFSANAFKDGSNYSGNYSILIVDR